MFAETVKCTALACLPQRVTVASPRLIMDFRDVTVGFLCDQIANSHDHQFCLFVCLPSDCTHARAARDVPLD